MGWVGAEGLGGDGMGGEMKGGCGDGVEGVMNMYIVQS